MIQNLKPYTRATLVEPQQVEKTDDSGAKTTQTVTDQTIAQGPVASPEIIKELGTNGGGFMNSNSSHPFENPPPLTNFFEIFCIFPLVSGLTYTSCRMTRTTNH